MLKKQISKTIKKTIAIITTMAIGLCVAGCGASQTEVTSEEGKRDGDGYEKKEITLVLDWTPNTNHTGIYVALHEGYYEEVGLHVNVIQPPEDGATMMVASGDAEFGIDFQDYLAPVYESGDIKVTAVAAILQHNTSGIISLKEDGITSPKGLEGKNYATWELPVEQAMLKNIVEADGGDFSKVNMIPETVTDEAAALQQNIDAIWVYYAWAGVATELAGLDTNMIYFKDINPAFDYYSPVIIANNDFLKDDPETAKAFLAATRKGYELAASNPSKAADILCEEVPELDKELVAKSQEWIAKEYISDAESWGYIDAERWDAFYAWLYENKLSGEIPAGTGFSNDYLK